MPAVRDELTVQAVGAAPLRIAPDSRGEGGPATDEAPPLRVTWDGPLPWSVVTLPVFGVAVGAGQKGAIHAGGMIIVGRDNVIGAGLRGEIAAGMNAASAAMGIVTAFRPTRPVLGIELNGRYLRPWSSNGNQRAEWGPELGLDIDSWRLTLTALGADVLTPVGQRRVVVGFGWGYF